jgi:hypothetical protein
VTLVISNCSKRKRIPLDSTLQARALPVGSTAVVAAAWAERLSQAEATTAAKNIYGGRAFVEASEAARLAGGSLLVVSAGLGLINAETLAPGYSLTTTRRDPDCILDKTREPATAWWAAVQASSPIQTSALETETGLILAALPAAYLSMVADDWSAWPEERLTRLRLFTKEQPTVGSSALRAAWMPYDDRLDVVGEPHQGTQGDFAQRAVRHFASTIGGGVIEDDRRAVAAALAGLTARSIPARVRMSDSEISEIIERDWDVVGGRSNTMLRRLRDDLLVACEQSRFQGLFNAVAGDRAEARLA